MATVARKRDSRNVSAVARRYSESWLPYDDWAERQAIGAVLLAPNGHSRRLVRRAYSGHFYDEGHGWIWEQLGIALVRSRLLLENEAQIGEWLQKSCVAGAFHERFGYRLSREVLECVEPGFWWHGDWYIDNVLVAAKLRAKVISHAEQLKEALDAAAKWRPIR